jgi:hypothetical protein
MLRSPMMLGWFGQLPPLATPAEWGLRFGTQTTANRELPRVASTLGRG